MSSTTLKASTLRRLPHSLSRSDHEALLSDSFIFVNPLFMQINLIFLVRSRLGRVSSSSFQSNVPSAQPRTDYLILPVRADLGASVSRMETISLLSLPRSSETHSSLQNLKVLVLQRPQRMQLGSLGRMRIHLKGTESSKRV